MTAEGPSPSERRFRALVENARDLIVVLDAEGRLTYASPSVERFLGYDLAKRVGSPVVADRLSDERPRLAAALTELYREAGATWSGRVAMADASGRPRTLEVRAQNLLHEPHVGGVLVNAWDVTDLVEAEAAVREREALLSRVVGGVPMVVFVLDEEGRFTLSEGQGLTTLGLEPGQAVGWSALEMYADHPRIPDDLRRALSGEELQTRREMGGRTYDTWFTPLDGGTLGVSLDVTERARAEERQRRLLRVIDHALDFVGIAGADLEVEHVNPAGRELLGLGPDEDLEGRRISEFHPEWALRKLREEAIPTAVEEGSWSGESAFLDLDGNEIPVWQVIVSHPVESGELEFLSTVATDLRERIRDQERIRFHANLLDAVGQAVIATDLEGYITYWNRAATDLYGWSAEEVRGKHIAGVTVPESARENAEAVMADLREGRSWTGEFQLHRKDGEAFPALVTNAPLENRAGELVGIVGVSSDLSRQKSLEQELREAQKMDAVGRLAGGIAHDFNNLLTAIQGHTDLLRHDLAAALAGDDADADAGEELVHNLDEIERATRRAADLTRQLLAFSRRQTFQVRRLDVRDEVTALRAMLGRIIPESIALEVDLPDEPAWVRADPSQVHQVLLNLTVNSVDALVGGGTLAIRVEHRDSVPDVFSEGGERSAGPWIHLQVADDGTGMIPEVAERVFEPFFTTKEVGKGTGLGLSTVFGIVKQSGGEVALESAPGEGTTVHVLLPALEGGTAS